MSSGDPNPTWKHIFKVKVTGEAGTPGLHSTILSGDHIRVTLEGEAAEGYDPTESYIVAIRDAAHSEDLGSDKPEPK